MKKAKARKQVEESQIPNKESFIARAEVKIYAPSKKVWDALVNSGIIRQYMFNTNAISDWKEGSSITWKGEWQGKPYIDKGVILRIEPERLLRYSHFSPLSGLPDTPENYHTITIELSGESGFTQVSLSQDNNLTAQARDHSEKNWEMVLAGLKRVVESNSLQVLFNEYEKAFAALDIKKSAGFFSDTFISAGPRGAIAQSKPEFLKRADKAAEFNRRGGQTSAKILSLKETAVSDQYSLMKIHWGVTFKKTGDTMIEFDVSYLVQKIGPEPKIILFIAHEDEEQAMKELGLL
jgi:uncharacterized protein YndB with AHSA1/START domain